MSEVATYAPPSVRYAAVRLSERPREDEPFVADAPAGRVIVRTTDASTASDLNLILAGTDSQSAGLASRWFAEQESGAKPISVSSKNVQVTLGRNHGSIVATQSEALVAAVAAAWAIRNELDELESEVATCWSIARKDISLTHAVSRERLASGEHVNIMTVRVAGLRFRLVELQRAASGRSIPRETTATFESLLDAVHIEDRVEILDDSIEVMEDVYELANDRLTEFTFFHREYRLEVLIVVVLLIEVLQIFGEIFFLAR